MAIINVEDAYILDETGEEVDKVTGLFTKDENTTAGEKAFAQLNIGGGGGGRNLLDNPFFTVRQRGNGPFTSAGYCVDRWYKYSVAGIVTPSSTGLELNLNGNSSMELRYFAEVGGYPTSGNGKTFTVSMMTSDGNVYSGQFTMASSGLDANVYFSVNGTNDVRVNLYTTATTLGIRFIFYTSLTVRAIKLELGSVSTLANDSPPNYAEELAKCKYYFERLKATSGYAVFGNGIAINATNAYIFVPITPKRTATYTVSSSGSLQLYNTAGHAITGVAKDYPGAQSLLALYITSTGLTAAANYLFRANSDANAYIDINADL